jgi:DNA repair protein RAD57
MTDLHSVLPDFATAPFSHLLPSLDRSLISTADLLTLDAVDVAKRAQLPPAEVTKLAKALFDALLANLQLYDVSADGGSCRGHNGKRADPNTRDWSVISSLDGHLDAALRGGVPTGYLTEITGER